MHLDRYLAGERSTFCPTLAFREFSQPGYRDCLPSGTIPREADTP